jgi:hypothetical protein
MKHFLCLMAMMGVLTVSATVTRMLPENGAVDVNIDTHLTLELAQDHLSASQHAGLWARVLCHH